MPVYLLRAHLHRHLASAMSMRHRRLAHTGYKDKIIALSGCIPTSQSANFDIRPGAFRNSAVKHRRPMSPAERTTSGQKSARRGAGTVTAASGSTRVRKVSFFSSFLFLDAAGILIAFVAYKSAC